MPSSSTTAIDSSALPYTTTDSSSLPTIHEQQQQQETDAANLQASENATPKRYRSHKHHTSNKKTNKKNRKSLKHQNGTFLGTTKSDLILLDSAGADATTTKKRKNGEPTPPSTTTSDAFSKAPMLSIETPPVTPFHVAKSWAPLVQDEHLHKLASMPSYESRTNGGSHHLEALLSPSMHHHRGASNNNNNSDLAKMASPLHSGRTSLNELRSTMRSKSTPPRLPPLSASVSKITTSVNKKQRQTLHRLEHYSPNVSVSQDSQYKNLIGSKKDSASWDSELNQMRKQLKKIYKDMNQIQLPHDAHALDGEHYSTGEGNHASQADNSHSSHTGAAAGSSSSSGASPDKKQYSGSKELKFRMPNKAISGLSKRLQKRILSLRAHPAEMYTFKQEMEKLAEVRKQRAKKRPKQFALVQKNMKNIDEQVLTKRINNHLEDHSRKFDRAQQNRAALIEEEEATKLQRMLQKQQRIQEMSKFHSPAERVAAFQFSEKQRAWYKYVAIGIAFQQLHWSLMEDRKKRIHTVTLNADATEEERKAFTIHKRRLLMEIRNESKDDISSNPFVARIRYALRRRQFAAHMIREYLKEQLKSKIIIGTIQHYKFCVLKCQEYVRNFLVCKRAQEKLLSLQFKQYELKRIEQAKKVMLQELSSIDSKTIAGNSLLQRQVQQKRLQLVNEEEQFATVPKEIRLAAVRQSLRKRRQEHVRQQVEWDRKLRQFRTERRKGSVAGTAVVAIDTAAAAATTTGDKSSAAADTPTSDSAPKEVDFDIPIRITRQHFSVLLSARDMNELIQQAEKRSTEMGRDLSMRRSHHEKPTLSRKSSMNLLRNRRGSTSGRPSLLARTGSQAHFSRRKTSALSRIRSIDIE